MKRFTMRVFQRMKTDYAQAAARRERDETPVERRLDLRELVVHMDADRLESARGGMLAGLARRHGARDDLRKLRRTRDRRLTTRRDDFASDALRETFLAVLTNYARQLVRRRLRDEVRCRRAAAVVHAHVERTVLREAEATRCVVELRRGHTEIEQHAVKSPNETRIRRYRAQLRKRTINQRQPPLQCKSFAPGPNRLRITIDRHDPALLARSLQNRRRVAAPTEGRIEITTAGANIECGQRFFEKHRRVLQHPCSLQRQRCEFRRQLLGGLINLQPRFPVLVPLRFIPQLETDCPDRSASPSRESCAYSRRLGGMRIRPLASRSRSVA